MKNKSSGGYRAGSGRPKGTGRYHEQTKPMRIPISLLPRVQELIRSTYSVPANDAHLLPLFSSKVAAGSPSAVSDEIEQHIDLNTYLIQRPSTVFLVRAKGDSMIDAGIYEDDLLIVDRAIEATSGKVVIAILGGELTVKRLGRENGNIVLIPENPKYNPIVIDGKMDFMILGVVIHAVHSL